jgi:exopolysaccharide biosynthesis WecB/TagA/CpsF family protein
LTQEEWADLMVADRLADPARLAVPKFMTSANGSVLSRYARDPEFKALVDQADGIDADGMPLVLASRLLSDAPLPQRVATLDFFHVAARRAAAAGMSFYFLGSREDENQGAVAQVRAVYPDLRIAGRHHGYISRDEEAAIVEQIVAAKTDVLWVAMGVPNEHQFIVRNRARLAGVAWVKSCGGMFKFLAGKAPRAPQWMQALCLEWLHRLFHEPVRLFSRYFRTNGHAIYLMYKYRALTRGGPRGTPHSPALARGGEGRSSAVDGA